MSTCSARTVYSPEAADDKNRMTHGKNCRLIDYYLPPGEGFVLESLVATTYQVDFEFFEEELLAAALGVRSPVSRLKAFRSELERKLQKAEVSVLYDLGGCDRLARLSPRIDAIPIVARKLHSKISLLMWVREDRAGGAPAGSTNALDRRIGESDPARVPPQLRVRCVLGLSVEEVTSPRALLTTAIGLVQQIGAQSQTPQLSRQLAAFAAQAALLPDGTAGPDDPVRLVAATEVVPAIRDSWGAISNKAPDTVRLSLPSGPKAARPPRRCLTCFNSLARQPVWSWSVAARSQRMGRPGCLCSTAASRLI